MRYRRRHPDLGREGIPGADRGSGFEPGSIGRSHAASRGGRKEEHPLCVW